MTIVQTPVHELAGRLADGLRSDLASRSLVCHRAGVDIDTVMLGTLILAFSVLEADGRAETRMHGDLKLYRRAEQRRLR